MARDEADREDLMAEATALRERVELVLPGEPDHVIAGFRESGFLSIYFGPDPVFQFDAEGRLRRAFLAGDLYRSQGHTLARLTRIRTGDAVQLVRHDLEPDELQRFLAETQERVGRLYTAVEQRSVRIIGQVPRESDLLPRLLQALKRTLQTRLSPTVRKRKS
jgi:hypothetical protein